MTAQDVDPATFYDVGRGLFRLAGDLFSAFDANVKGLAETGAMAGSDDAGTAWATSYDSRVSEVLGAVNDLTVALENYGGVVIQAGYNHAVAEHNATPATAGPAPVKPPEPASAARELSSPPSAGGPGEGLIELVGLVEHIGIPVPDGDTDKVDKAAQVWSQLAIGDKTGVATRSLEASAQKFTGTKTPEVDFIAKDLRELRDATQAVLDSCGELSQSCNDYKSALDELRESLKGILEDLAIELAATAAIAIAASFITFGAGAVAGTAKAAHSIKKFAGIVRTAINGWKVSKNISKGVKKAHDVAGVRRRLERIKNLGRKSKREAPKPPPPPPALPSGVKPGWTSRTANNGKGTTYQKPGSPGDSNSVRIMEPGADPRYPNGYVKFTNEHNQPITLDGKPGSRAQTHIPRNPDGSYPIPTGW